MRKLFLIIMLSVACMGYAQTVDTLYYDRDWKGVDSKVFAEYYRVMLIPADPNYPKRYKDFTIDGTLQESGTFISIDKFDDSKSVFHGKLTFYYPSGKVSEERSLNNGVLHGECKAFWEDGKIKAIIMYKDGIQEGDYKAYDSAGHILFDGKLSNGNFSGVQNIYENNMLRMSIKGNTSNAVVNYYGENGNLARVEEYSNGLLNGNVVDYYPSGAISSRTPYLNGKLNGIQEVLDDAGNQVSNCNYENNLKVGTYEYIDGTAKHKGVYKDISNGDNNSVRVSVNARMVSYLLKTEFSVMTALFLDARNAMVDKYVHACSFEINCSNESKANLQCKIEDVEVLYFKKDKPSKNKALTEDAVTNIYEMAGEHIINSAYTTAQNNAYAAATTSSSGYSRGGASNSTNVSSNSSTSGYASTSASVIGAAIGANNSGDAAAVIGAAAGQANTAAYSNTSTNTYANQSVNSYNVTSHTATDGYTQYQVYQQEKQVAQETQKQVQENVRNLMSKASYSQFTIQPNNIIVKEIMAELEKKFDSVQLTFKLNGVKYSATWAISEIEQ